jgi:hypothetical protein
MHKISPTMVGRLGFLAAPRMAGNALRPNACPQQAIHQASMVSPMGGFDPGLASAATIFGSLLWLLVEGLERKPQGWLAEDAQRHLEVNSVAVETEQTSRVRIP